MLLTENWWQLKEKDFLTLGCTKSHKVLKKKSHKAFPTVALNITVEVSLSDSHYLQDNRNKWRPVVSEDQVQIVREIPSCNIISTAFSRSTIKYCRGMRKQKSAQSRYSRCGLSVVDGADSISTVSKSKTHPWFVWIVMINVMIVEWQSKSLTRTVKKK